jgi:hypothetical protein
MSLQKLETNIIITTKDESIDLKKLYPNIQHVTEIEVTDGNHQLILTDYQAEEMIYCFNKLLDAGIKPPRFQVRDQVITDNHYLKIKGVNVYCFREMTSTDEDPLLRRYNLTITTRFGSCDTSDENEKLQYHYNRVEQVVDELTQKGFKITSSECKLQQLVSC